MPGPIQNESLIKQDLIKNQQNQDVIVKQKLAAQKQQQKVQLMDEELKKQIKKQAHTAAEAKKQKDLKPLEDLEAKKKAAIIAQQSQAVSPKGDKKNADLPTVITLSQGLKDLSEKHAKAVEKIFTENKVYAEDKPEIKAQQERILTGSHEAADLKLTGQERKERKAIIKAVAKETKTRNPVAKAELSREEKYIKNRQARELTLMATAAALGGPTTRKAVIEAYAQLLRDDRMTLTQLASIYSNIEQFPNPPVKSSMMPARNQHYYKAHIDELEADKDLGISRLYNNDVTPAGRAPISVPHVPKAPGSRG